MVNRVSIKTIAEKLGVSKTTVSFVLNGKGDENNISKETQKKVFETAKKLNYKPNQIARSLISGKSNTIGLIVPDISNPFFADIGMYIELFANKKGYTVMFASTMENVENEKKKLDVFISRQVDGLIIAPTLKLPNLRKQLSSRNLPTVYFDRIEKEQIKSFVDINNEASTKKLTEYLIRKKHRRIGLVSLTSYLPNITSRIEGYKNALRIHEIEIDNKIIFDMEYDQKENGVKLALDKMLNHPNPVTAIIFLNNMLAAEGIWNINMYYKEVARNLSLASFDNLEFFDYSTPPVTSVIQPRKEMARYCVDMLIEIIENQKEQSGVRLETEIVER